MGGVNTYAFQRFIGALLNRRGGMNVEWLLKDINTVVVTCERQVMRQLNKCVDSSALG